MTSLPNQVHTQVPASPLEAAPPVLPSDPLVFASGGAGGRRLIRTGVGLSLLGAAWLSLLIGNDIGDLLGLLLATSGVLLLIVTFWRRGRAFEVRREGICVQHGGRLFGESTLIPWESITFFGAKPTRDGRVCLVYRQQHIHGDLTLPGSKRDATDYAALVERLRFVLGNRYPGLRLGAVG